MITWNVNGLRAVLGKGSLDRLLALSRGRDLSAGDQSSPRPARGGGFICPARLSRGLESALRPGYSGVVTSSRPQPLQMRTGLGVEEVRWGGSPGRCSRYPGFWLFNIYFPNGQRDHERLDYKLRFYAELLDLCNDWHAAGERIILTGDFNTAHREIDLRNPKQNEDTSGFMPE